MSISTAIGACRRFSFGLPHWGWFLLPTAAIALSVAGFSFWWPYYQEQVVIRRIEALGGSVETEIEAPEWLHRHFSKECLRGLKVFDRVWRVHLDDTDADDSELAYLPRLTSLAGLHLKRTRVTDAGLTHLQRMTNLVGLFLDETSISDAGLGPIGGLKNLKMLWLDRTHVTNAGLSRLDRLTTLAELSLNETPTNDDGLRQLARLSGLSLVELRSTAVTDTGIAELKLALQNISIMQ